jgi:hypothetical protein
MTRRARRHGAVVLAATSLLALSWTAGTASGRGWHWREARTSQARLSVTPRHWADDAPGLIRMSGHVPGTGNYLVFVMAQPPDRGCPRYPPRAALHEGVAVGQGDFRASADPYARDGQPVAGSKVRACGYLVRSHSARRVARPIVVARAQVVGTPRHDPSDLVGAIILALLLVGGFFAGRTALRRSRRAAANRASGVWPPPPVRRPGAGAARPTGPLSAPPRRPGPPPGGRWSPPAPTRRPPSAPGTRRRCPHHLDKVEYATQAEAQDWVDYTRRRKAQGTWDGEPMDHCYECPAVGGHWHVTKKPRRW